MGLEVQDVDLQERSITIRPNGIQGLKANRSRRTIPLSQAAETLQEHRQGKEESEAIFLKYAHPRDSEAATA